jgi:phytoene dehydrogenase-like protein
MVARSVDAVVVGAGPNGLVAANALVDAGWDVVLVEAADEVGGAVRTAEVTAPGYRTDLFSAFYPLAAASPVIRDLELDRHGLVWRRAPAVLAHALDDGRAAVLEEDPDATADALDRVAPGDGDAWLDLVAQWDAVRDDVLAALFTPFPPLRAVARLLWRSGARGTLDLARLAVLPVRRLGQERFRGDGAPLLLTGNAMHSDAPPDAGGSGLLGWLLTMLGQDVGFPVPEGGAGALSEALAARFRAAGGEVLTGSRVTAVAVAGGRAVGVLTADGLRLRARRAVLADVAAPALYRDLLGPRHAPARLLDDLDAFQWDHPTLKVNWALASPVPWRAAEPRRAGTVHLGVDLDGFVRAAADLSTGVVPRDPFVLLGQMTTADPTRSPAGTESAWAYTHLPHPDLGPDEIAAHVARVEDAVERAAPGFPDAVVARRSASSARRSSDSRLRGTSAAARSGRGTRAPGPRTASSVIRTTQPAPSGRTSSTTRASPAGQACAWSSSRSVGSHARDSVTSSRRTGHRPTECAMRVPGAGQSGSTARIRDAPTTQVAYAHPSASTASTASAGQRMRRVTVTIRRT